MSQVSSSFKVSKGAFLADMRRMDRQMLTYTPVGLRAVAQELVKAEKRLAPVYAGPNGITRKSLQKAKAKPARNGRPVTGLLKFSIKTGRARRDGLGGFSYVVGPGGGRVNLYKNKIERKYHFAEAAYQETIPKSRVIMDAAWAKALKKFK